MNLEKHFPIFTTITCYDWIYLLEQEHIKDIIIDSLRYFGLLVTLAYAYCYTKLNTNKGDEYKYQQLREERIKLIENN